MKYARLCARARSYLVRTLAFYATLFLAQDNNNGTALSSDEPLNKRPGSQTGGDLQVGNLLGLGSLGINSLSALGPVITAMAGLLQGKTASASRRNDTASSLAETQEVTTQRSPIYIPVAEFADGDIETAESQNIGDSLSFSFSSRYLIPSLFLTLSPIFSYFFHSVLLNALKFLHFFLFDSLECFYSSHFSLFSSFSTL